MEWGPRKSDHFVYTRYRRERSRIGRYLVVGNEEAFELAARALDKCRTTLAGTNGDYEFNCPLDQRFFAHTGLNAEQFREFVATGTTDDQVAQCITEKAKPEE